MIWHIFAVLDFFVFTGPTALPLPALGNAKVMRRHNIRGLKARDMGRLVGDPPSHGSGFQLSIFMVMTLPMALPWAGMLPGRWP